MAKLHKKLKNKFDNPYFSEYSVMGAIRSWLSQCGIKTSEKNMRKVMAANEGKIFYPYQKKDRKRVIKNLKHVKQ